MIRAESRLARLEARLIALKAAGPAKQGEHDRVEAAVKAARAALSK